MLLVVITVVVTDFILTFCFSYLPCDWPVANFRHQLEFQLEGHKVSCSEVGPRRPLEHLVEFKAAAVQISSNILAHRANLP